MNEHRLSCTLHRPDGAALRFGPDEASPGDVPTDIGFGTEVPGWGFAEGRVTLARPAAMSDLDPNLFARATFYDEGGETVYEGRVVGFPRQSQSELSVELEGLAAHLDDDPSARMIYRDVDLGNWRGMGTTRKINLIGGGTFGGVSDGQVTPDTSTGAPSMLCEHEGDWVVNALPMIESWYDAGPAAAIGKIAGSWTRSAVTASTNWRWEAAAYDTDAGSGGVTSGDLQSEPTATATFDYTPTAGKRYAALRFYWNSVSAVSGFANVKYGVYWSDLAVYGNHGLTVRGSEPDAGFYASDVVADALGRWAPLLSEAEPDGIEDSTFLIPHLVFRDQTTARAVIEAVSAYGAAGFVPPDWGCYEGGFFWKTPGSYGRTWRVRRDQAAIPQDEGPTTDSRCNGFIVQYADAAGETKSVGPPGSACDYETSTLADDDPENPVNAAGIPRRYGQRSVGITSQEGAVLIGELCLRDANTRPYKGTVELQGEVADDAGNLHPVYMVRAGDYVVVEDDEDTTPRKIVSTDYDGGTLKAELDNRQTKIDTLLSRLEVAIKPAGF